MHTLLSWWVDPPERCPSYIYMGGHFHPLSVSRQSTFILQHHKDIHVPYAHIAYPFLPHLHAVGIALQPEKESSGLPDVPSWVRDRLVEMSAASIDNKVSLYSILFDLDLPRSTMNDPS